MQNKRVWGHDAGTIPDKYNMICVSAVWRSRERRARYTRFYLIVITIYKKKRQNCNEKQTW